MNDDEISSCLGCGCIVFLAIVASVAVAIPVAVFFQWLGGQL